MKKRYFEAYTQIIILIVATIAFSYFAHENSIQNIIDTKEENAKELPSVLLFLLRTINKIIWSEKTIVSALDSSVLTCIKTKNDESCKVFYDSGACESECVSPCIPNPASEVSGCELGTCYDPDGGICQFNSPRGLCEGDGGIWSNPAENVQRCKTGCCVIRSNANLYTEQTCTKMSNLSGVEKNFKPEIKTQIECISQTQLDLKGACVLGSPDAITGKYDCKFLTKRSCTSLRGYWKEGTLCSNPELNTRCEKEKTTNCITGKDEIYWFDSCGNIENIYQAPTSWNNGMVLNQGICVLDDYNKGTCGNCNRFSGGGSTCGLKTNTEKLSDGTQKVVCRSLSCTDETDNNHVRINGESWCVYQGAIGVEDGRAVDTPGSRHFRKTCIDGEIRIEEGEDYRTNVCVESRAISPTTNTEVSSAVWLKNEGNLCIDINNNEDAAKRLELCNKNKFCWVKSINIADNFKFDLCVPKYPVGSNLKTGVGSGACGLASLTCTAVKIKKLKIHWTTGGKWEANWKWEYNKGCVTGNFAEQMNDLCMSLGDCGAEVSYKGELTTNYQISGGAGLSPGYIDELEKYQHVISGKVAEPPDVGSSSASINADLDSWQADDSMEARLKKIISISGTGGSLLWMFGGKAFAAATAADVTVTTKVGDMLSPNLAGIGGAVIGAAIGVALTSSILKGHTAGMPPSAVRFLLYAGAAGGAYLGATYIGGASLTGSLGAGALIPVIGWILAIVAILGSAMMHWLGVGKVKKVPVTFTCSPWEPPHGGAACETCGDDGLGCSEYACHALGTTCEYRNEGTKDEICIDVPPTDILPPMITPLAGMLSSGIEYKEINDFSVKIRTSENECIESNSLISFGLNLSKYGKCRYSYFPSIEYKNMIPGGAPAEEDEDLPPNMGNNLNAIPKKEIPITMRMKSLYELTGNSVYKPGSTSEYNMYVKCENALGNAADYDYTINFCIKPENDTTAPAIEKIEPVIRFVNAEATEKAVSVWTNEPSDCRWDSSEKEYTSMINNFTCANDFEEQTLWGWMCTTNLTMPLNVNNITAYIRCEDKPWATDEEVPEYNLSCAEGGRCQNTESTILALKRTTKLEIYSATPNNITITSNVEPVSVGVEVKTSGGLDGTAKCEYSFDGNNYIPFRYTFGSTHTQIFSSFMAGNKKIGIMCEDDVGNLAYKNITFGIEIDTDAPKITRIYYLGGSLIIKTTEQATCALSLDECTFNFANGTLMSGSAFDHSASVEKNKVYYAKCKDNIGNVAGVCDSQFKVV